MESTDDHALPLPRRPQTPREVVGPTLTQAAPGPVELDAPLTPGGDTATVPQAFGRYRVRKRLSGGGFGDVYLAEDTELARLVALKVPRRDRFHSEQ